MAAGVLAYLAVSVDLDAVLDAFSRVSIWQFVAFTILYQAALLTTDSFALWVSLRDTAPGLAIDFPHVVLVRGATYLLAAISYSVGQGGIVYFLRSAYKVPFAASAGAVLLTSIGFVLVIAGVIAGGLATHSIPDIPGLFGIAIGVVAIIPLYLLTIALRPRVFARWPALAPVLRARPRHILRAVGSRALHTVALLGGHYVAMHIFGIDVPIGAALARLPVLIVVNALPVSPAGLGTTQAAAVVLFSAFAPGDTPGAREATVLAYSLSFHVLSQGFGALLSLPCLRGLPHGLKATEPPAPPPD
ncbi:MAG TPA: lysylphosphatidylglycerol synthase transmembrane domain-containing protein [Kofleriaceae bacterium]|nr:lysylphosphatidylglycerol synthase transmembrane domain-containing protein [Kofleriaceae bacterium]